MVETIVDESKNNYTRIPNSQEIYPLNYKLHIVPNFKQFTFEGQVEIDIHCYTDGIKSIVLNTLAINIKDGHYKRKHDTSVDPLSKVTFNPKSEMSMLEFKSGKDLITGVLSLNFSGILDDKMKGLYRTSWVDAEGKTIHAASSQCEATDARRIIPCWDEPSFKATFEASVGIPSDIDESYIALSNMPAIDIVSEKDYRVFKFSKTPRMSSYLLAFAIGPFVYISTLDSKNREIRVYTRAEKKSEAEFSLKIAAKSLEYYENYFNIPYPLTKMDMIAIPDFMMGAMENWGLITYRESCMLVDPNNTSTARKQYVALVVTHEIAHQWFGNLVTMEWWTHLWLNEGFATFMEYLCTDHICPEYNIWSDFVTSSFLTALHLDSLHNSHPIEVVVKNAAEIDEIFDSISYQKGATVIRMLYSYIGDAAFRKGMEQYLKKFAYNNASTEDLWQSLEEASGKPIGKIMSIWTAEKGFPWLSVSCKKDGKSMSLTLRQEKFAADGKVLEKEKSCLWKIPVSVFTGADHKLITKNLLMETKETVVTIDDVDNNWIKLNFGSINPFRTAYPPELMDRFGPAIVSKHLPPLDRLGLQDDYFALSQAGNVPTTELLKLLTNFKEEDEYSVICSIDTCISTLQLMLTDLDCYPNYKQFVRTLYANMYNKVGWTSRKGEAPTEGMKRGLILNRLVSVQDEKVIGEAKDMFKQYISDQTKLIEPDVRGAVYRAVVAYGDETDFEALFKLFRTSTDVEEKNRITKSLGFCKDAVRFQKALDFSMTEELKSQDKMFIFVTAGSTHPTETFEFFKQNREYFMKTLGVSPCLTRIVKFVTSNFVTEQKAVEIEDYFKANPIAGAERTVQQSVESVRLYSKWLARDAENICKYLSQL